MHALRLVPAFAALAAVTACLSPREENESFPGTRAHVAAEAQLVEIVPPAAESAGRYTSRWLRPLCDESGVVRVDTMEETTRFWIGAGAGEGGADRLYLWNEQNCEGLKLSGSGSVLQGTWSLNGFPRYEPLPGFLQEFGCHGSSDYFFGIVHDDDEEGLLRNVSATYAFDDEKAVASVSLDVCYAPNYAGSLLIEDGMVVEVEECGMVRLRNARGGAAVVRTGFRDNKNHVKFVHENVTCRMSTPFEMAPGEARCDDGLGIAFWECVKNSGFFEDRRP